ncbi:MAG: bifunctional DNA-formamidopyrimidine glycosylase/DNA-(apurinic or apyrimidinic site) lyase [Candidatus Aminicenantes bacterium]|nr:bifunctional DNA-formamidopyrimidine glycosylase/DNA-(apurinic or apyrimidinic site) lyase [Candidatus Aminicenantes bacterium]
MPELPEVESVARSLRRRVLGLRIASVEAFPPQGKAGRAAGTGWGGGRAARAASAVPLTELAGKTIDKVGRRGKVLILECGGLALLFHLKMTGRFLWSRPGRPRGRHVHLVLHFRRPARELHFEDVRKFGLVRCRPLAGLAACPELCTLGPEPFDVTAGEFAARLKARRGRMKSVLLDQSFLAGIGNIYADEALFEAGVHPLAAASRLSRPRADRLGAAVRDVLARAIAAGGSSIRDYRNADGELGSFQDEHKVYGRAGEPCPRCGGPIRRAVIGGRSSHYCPRCQKK